jgi:formate dehydrogenase (coenzyme F420) beta subunit
MANVAKIEVKDRNPVTSLQEFLKALLSLEEIDALLVAQHLHMKNAVMPTLVTDPDKLDGADPLAPAFPINAAKVVSKLTRKPLGGKVAVVLRPCELRAFVELVKLKQGSTEEVVLIGMDCLGAFGNTSYARFAAGKGPESTLRFYQEYGAGNGTGSGEIDISPACKACEHPTADIADLSIGLLGVDINESLLLKASTPKGQELLDKLKLPPAAEPDNRKQAIAELTATRTAYCDQMFKETSEATADLEKLMSHLSGCVNCYNCRVACPVCYCKECVFVTDVFDHEPSQYLRWAKRKGILKMPTDTVFYHLTRLAHMSTACIGCGQCSNACPNDVPVMELFRTIAAHTQRAFSYTAGRSFEEEPPLSIFREKEFSEVTGGKD